MRLQYAKLKVEHGWQRQNLTEVENLYFHHSGRIGRPAAPPPKVVTIPPADQPMLPSAFNFTSDQFPTTSSHLKSPTPPVAQPPISSDSARTPTPQAAVQPSSQNQPPDHSSRRSGSPSQSITDLRTPTPPMTTSNLQSQPSVSKLPSTSLPPSAYQPAPSTGQSVGSGNGSPNLTYDSFWSSHSLSNMALTYRMRTTTNSSSGAPAPSSPHGSASSLHAPVATTNTGVSTPNTNGNSTLPPSMGAYGALPVAQHAQLYAANAGMMGMPGMTGYAPAAVGVQSSTGPSAS
ncbi:hypothetical protein CONPUDRAFT_170324 [Coniophora puteana RWD-64-598 SS2]|uniref:Uncharacterized protein n=1 Tax=Coniophora puteana (strain RWD-64-598) TaxID=741705 RepID=R7SCY5_CONPW|nr:uncharacterized protein CONPUDRAFT_170324 [Coniophora puteana RWD-64-598 SS2]EIW74028.1 hypothetical protein CONPUDRAFT_170324 [Coniophora puteana RWD-64-598 SS2]